MEQYLKQLKSPLVMITLFSGLIGIIGALVGWVDYPNFSDGSIADTTLHNHQLTVIVLLIFSIGLIKSGLFFRQYWLNLVSLTLSIAAVLVAFRHIPGQEQVRVFEPAILPGLPMTLIGASLLVIGAMLLYIKTLDEHGDKNKR